LLIFEVRNLTHNPKLVAVTSCHKGAGVSSIAAGLAASLSETGDGNVLLVDMNGERGAAQHFYKGSRAAGWMMPLETETMSNAWCKEICTLPPSGWKTANSRGFCPSDLQADAQAQGE